MVGVTEKNDVFLSGTKDRHTFGETSEANILPVVVIFRYCLAIP
jgi:hypothetical protein